MKKTKYLIGFTIVVILATAILFWQLRGNLSGTQNDNTKLVNAQSHNVPLYVSEYHVIVEVVGVGSVGSNELRIVNSETGAVRKTFSAMNPSVLHAFIWDQKSSRIYFSSTSVNENLTTFFFIDLNGPDPNAVSEIVYDPSKKIYGKLEIIGSDNHIIYFLSMNKLYYLNIDEGMTAPPIFIRQID